jgi:hypothetical protein
MSTYETAYSNTTTDLVSVVPDIEAYDQKKMLTNWAVFSGNKYYTQSGYVSQLYMNGNELGSAQANLAALTENNEWFYDSGPDITYVYNSSNSPNEDRMEAGVDWETLKTRVNNEQAERIRSYLQRPILPRKGVGTASASSRDWDWIIIRANATLTCSELMRAHNTEMADELEKRIIDAENEQGLLDRLKRSEYALWNEASFDKIKGIREVSINGSTTSAIVDIRGEPTDTDILKIIIINGATLASGSASSVTYSTFGKDSTGIKIAKIINAETVTGGWNHVGLGMYVRWSAGVLTANDEWELEIMGNEPEENPKVKSIQATR